MEEKLKKHAQQYFDKNPSLAVMYVSDSGHCFYSMADASYFLTHSAEKIHEIKREKVKEVEEIEIPKAKITKK